MNALEIRELQDRLDDMERADLIDWLEIALTELTVAQEQRDTLLTAAQKTREMLGVITGQEFSLGGDKPERDALDVAISSVTGEPLED